MLKNLQEILSGDIEQALHRLWSDQLSEAEAAAINNRVRCDPKYREAFDGSLAFLASMQGLEGDCEIEEVAREFPRLLQERRTRQRFALGMAAGILVTLGAVLTVYSPWRGPDDSHLQRYFTRIGEQQTIELADGSVVTLNTGGQLVVDYSEPARRILLQRGEAYFEVAEDPERPFTVDLGTHAVTAIGTAFNVRKDPERYQVAVIEGAVAIHEATDNASSSSPPVSADGNWAGGRSMALSAPRQHRVDAGWVAEFDVRRGELTAFQPESMDRYRFWRSGLLDFSREPLYQVVQELNRYSSKKVMIEDASIMELNVYTVIRVDDIDSAVKRLELVLPIKVTQHYDRIVITASAENENKGHRTQG